MLNLTLTTRDQGYVDRAVAAARAAAQPNYLSRAWATMDLANVHLNACPLDLEEMGTDRGDPIRAHDLVAFLRILDVCLDRPRGRLDKTGPVYHPSFAARRSL